jgi:hypothetical protein
MLFSDEWSTMKDDSNTYWLMETMIFKIYRILESIKIKNDEIDCTNASIINVWNEWKFDKKA